MGILHRHILASVVGASAAAVGLFTFVLIAGQALRDLLGYVAAGQLQPESALKLIWLLLPYVAFNALPIGLLTAVLLVLGRMSSQQEITAMRAAGLGLGYICRPVWIVACVAVLFSLYLNFHAMPQARTAYSATLVDAVRQSPLSFIAPRTFVRDFPGFVVYVGERDGSEMKDFWLWQLDTQQQVVGMVRAQSGFIDYREADNRLVLTLRDVSAEPRDRDRPEDFSRPQPIANSDTSSFEFNLSGVFGGATTVRRTKWMTLDQLLTLRAELSGMGGQASPEQRTELTRVTMTISDKAAKSFSVLALVMVAVPLGIKVSRKETSANLGIAVLLVLGFYFFTALTGMLERHPDLRPEIWVWLTPVGYATAGIWLFRRVGRT
jgi:lipopolysaccharide export system permease protein